MFRILFTLTIFLTCSRSLLSDDLVPNSQPLTWEGDIASRLIDSVDQFLDKQIKLTSENRVKLWNNDPEALADFTSYLQSLQAISKYQTEDEIILHNHFDPSDKILDENRLVMTHRQSAIQGVLARILGVTDQRIPFDDLSLVASVNQPALVAKTEKFSVYNIRWPVTRLIFGEGLLIKPKGKQTSIAIVIPDCEDSPEDIAGLTDKLSARSRYAQQLAETGALVIVPALISRSKQFRGPKVQPNRIQLTNREYVYRSSFDLGRSVTGYEVQKVLALVDHFKKVNAVVGTGEGGRTALFAAALDPRIQSVQITGYFHSRDALWSEPIDRNLFGLTRFFSDAELLALLRDRSITVVDTKVNEIQYPSDRGGPGAIVQPGPISVQTEWDRYQDLQSTKTKINPTPVIKNVTKTQSYRPLSSDEDEAVPSLTEWTIHHLPDSKQREERLVQQMILQNESILAASSEFRKKRLDKLIVPKDMESFLADQKAYRDFFYEHVIGRFDIPLEEANPRSRKIDETEKWTRYEIVLDVFDEVFAYGILTIPKNIKTNEKRPVVVCQHGLEGRPQDTLGESKFRAYKAFATKLAERGYITFAPQNIYIFKDRFRQLQRKANPLGKSLFSIMVPQHQQIVDWLKTLEMVNEDKIGFYGLSYGGKSAMRIPALVEGYALSICSADFNEWVHKNASTEAKYSYVWTGEYEIFEWNLAHTFNYAEMAALIAPRPFMVERGHYDGVGIDEWVAFEFAKIRHLYQAKLGISERTEIEWFVGPHTINGVGTFRFLDKWLKE
jgi:dienelactone hydrolase